MKIVKFGNVVKAAGAFASVASIFTMVEKCLTDVRLIHEPLPFRHQPKIAPGRMLTVL